LSIGAASDEHGVTLWDAPVLENTQVEVPDGSIKALVSLGQHASIPQKYVSFTTIDLFFLLFFLSSNQ
jgi:hypothetical protein